MTPEAFSDNLIVPGVSRSARGLSLRETGGRAVPRPGAAA